MKLYGVKQNIHSFGQALPAIPGVTFGTQNFSYPFMQSSFDVGIFTLKMEIMENKELDGECRKRKWKNS